MEQRPYTLSIAGFDPSGGAGLLADIKTFEQYQVYGLGVCTAMTCQTDAEFLKLEWIDTAGIEKQMRVLLSRFEIASCKIGLISSFETMDYVISLLKELQPAIHIVVDPVLGSSTGKVFHHAPDPSAIIRILNAANVITPNLPELEALESILPGKLGDYGNVLLKGGHSTSRQGTDLLFLRGEELQEIPAGKVQAYPKHGSGCVLSAAIAAGLALGLPLPDSCIRAKAYTESFLGSSAGLLGYHNIRLSS